MQTILLSNDQVLTLKMYLLMSSKSRQKEIEACEKLATTLDDNGELKYPAISKNAEWWKEADETLEQIITLL